MHRGEATGLAAEFGMSSGTLKQAAKEWLRLVTATIILVFAALLIQELTLPRPRTSAAARLLLEAAQNASLVSAFLMVAVGHTVACHRAAVAAAEAALECLTVAVLTVGLLFFLHSGVIPATVVAEFGSSSASDLRMHIFITLGVVAAALYWIGLVTGQRKGASGRRSIVLIGWVSGLVSLLCFSVAWMSHSAGSGGLDWPVVILLYCPAAALGIASLVVYRMSTSNGRTHHE